MNQGCFTALITPFKEDAIDRKGLDALIEFQIASGISGILAVGTTGESPTLNWEEHNEVIEIVADKTNGKCICIAGTGSNNTKETLEATSHAEKAGSQAVLLVDPYYNGPSSCEIRREYIQPVAQAFPDIEIIPYVIPGRTGTQLLPEDIAILARDNKNVNIVKEATGNLDNMKRTRQVCGPDFTILSGDDDLTLTMMTDPDILASGVVSVLTNVAPKAIIEMVQAAQNKDFDKAASLKNALKPLFSLVTVSTTEETPFGPVTFRARNPLAVKTLMAVLKMPGGFCRRPLGKMSKKGLDVVVGAARKVWQENPEILQPAADHFGLDIEASLRDEKYMQSFAYIDY